MSTVDEVKISGRKFRFWDEVNEVWKRVSYWTKASDVEFDSGTNLEDRMSAKDTEITDLGTDITNLGTSVDTNYVKKAQLVFTLSGNDLYITKTY